jgi:hypothetical protein
MVVRKKNLLDAFQASAPEGRIAAGRRDDVRSSAGGPFAPVRSPAEPGAKSSESGATASASDVRATAPDTKASMPDARGLMPDAKASMTDAKASMIWPASPRAPRWRRWLGDPAIRVALVAGVLCIAIAYWLGRRQGPTVEAIDSTVPLPASGALLRSGAESAAAPSETDLAKHNLATAQAGSTDDQQFMNPANKYTVRVKTFSNDASGKAAARALHDYFVKESLPVILPITQGKSCVVYVGHADKKKVADQLASYLQRMHAPGSDSKKPSFEDAYVVNIDDVVKR